VRQQRNFSPPETTREIEDYQVELSDVSVIDLIIVIVPDNSPRSGSPSLKSLRLA
jgi:hypothetical protein